MARASKIEADERVASNEGTSKPNVFMKVKKNS